MSIRRLTRGAVGTSDEYLGGANPALQVIAGLALVALGQVLTGIIPIAYFQSLSFIAYLGVLPLVIGVGNFGAGLARGLLQLAGSDWESAGGIAQTGVLFVVSLFIFALMLSPVILAVIL